METEIEIATGSRIESFNVRKKINRSKTDDAWKLVIEKYLKEFLQLCWNQAYQEIDWNKPYEFLEQELKTIVQFYNKKRISDKLIKVFLKNGKEQWLLIHFEVQGREEVDFEERMYVSNYRIFDRYQKTVVSMAVLIDSSKKWRSKSYKKEKWGYSVQMNFPILKILDFKGKEKELKESKNPFAKVILCQLKAIESGFNENKKLLNKKEMVKMLYEEGFARDEVLNIGRFLDGIFVMSKDLNLEYNSFVESIEREKVMSYMTTFEEVGFEKGIVAGHKKGIEEGEKILLLRQLNLKFGSSSDFYKEKINLASSEKLIEWAEKVLFCNQIEEIFEN